MPIPFHVQMQESRPADVSIRQWRETMRGANEAAGEFWHSEILPDHWKPNAAGKYHHKHRSLAWIKRKQQLAARGLVDPQAPTTDNLATGFLRDQFLQVATIRPFPSRVTIEMFGPRYISMRPRDSKQPNKAAEITFVTADEARRIATIQDRYVQKHHADL